MVMILDIEKVDDYLNLSKEEFLKTYSYLTDKDYEEINKEYLEDKPLFLACLFREAENLFIEEMNGRSNLAVTSEKVKDTVLKIVNSFSLQEYKEFINNCISMSC